MKCEKCKYKQAIGNTRETGAALCTKNTTYFPINCKDDCHFIPKMKELCCSDCVRFGEDSACMTAEADDKVYSDGRLCGGFIDAKEEEFMKILMFWKVQNLYDRAKIEKMIDEFEEFYNDTEKETMN